MRGFLTAVSTHIRQFVLRCFTDDTWLCLLACLPACPEIQAPARFFFYLFLHSSCFLFFQKKKKREEIENSGAYIILQRCTWKRFTFDKNFSSFSSLHSSKGFFSLLLIFFWYNIMLSRWSTFLHNQKKKETNWIFFSYTQWRRNDNDVVMDCN